jgi:aryl-alcohol dehydrogenase-like predicted oxidoreductase
MRRRTFLQLPPAVLAADLRLLAEAPMPMATLGKSGLKVSRFCVGGYHMAVKGDETGVRIIHRAMDLGVNFFDCAWLYHDGRSESVYGKALGDGRRRKVLLMSKAHDRTRDGAMKQLEDTLGRMKTDYLDLWQCHQVTGQKEVDQILGPAGALEAFVKAKQQGKVRHIGFTGHADPAVHQRLLDSFDGWETVQHPVNLIDPHYLSFINSVMPNIRKKGLGLLAMKSNGMGSIGKASIAPIAECLRFAWSHDVDAVVSGVETVEQLEQNVAVLKTLKPMSNEEIAAVLERTRKGPHGPKVEGYKKKEGTAAGPVHRDGEPA